MPQLESPELEHGKEVAEPGGQDLWTPENLRDIFLGEERSARERYQKMLAIEADKSLAASEKAQKLAENINEHGEFLVKLWSAVYHIALGRLPTDRKPETLRQVFLEINRAHKIEDKIELARKLYNLANSYHKDIELTLAEIDRFAAESDALALKQLESLKKDTSDSLRNYRRAENFNSDLDISKIPPFTARFLLEEYLIKIAKVEAEDQKPRPRV